MAFLLSERETLAGVLHFWAEAAEGCSLPAGPQASGGGQAGGQDAGVRAGGGSSNQTQLGSREREVRPGRGGRGGQVGRR